jgi:hypothetical protein
MDIDACRTKKVSIEELVPVTALAIAEFRIQHFSEFVGDLFILGIDELGDENTRKKAREIVEFNGELSEIPVRKVSGAKPGEIGIVDCAVAEHEPPHVLMECHGNPSRTWSGSESDPS